MWHPIRLPVRQKLTPQHFEPDTASRSTHSVSGAVPGAVHAKAAMERFLLRAGRPLAVGIITLVSVVVSWGITVLVFWCWGAELSSAGQVAALVAPVLIAAPISWIVIGLLLKVRENAQALQRAQAELLRSEKLAALGSLVVGVAHQLGTPIGNSVTVASALQERTRALADTLADGMRRSALETFVADTTYGSEILMRNLQQIAELVENFKQIAADQDHGYRRCFDLREVIEKTLHILRPAYADDRHVLVMDVQTNVELDSFPEQLEQVLVLLVNNAVLHGFEGRQGGTVTVRARQKNHRTVRISVRDNGCGIPIQHQARIFEPFFTTKLGTGGSGLGLAVVRNIVDHVLGGRIHAVSQVGEGTKVVIDIPLHAPEVLSEPQFMLSGNYSGMQRNFQSSY